MSTFLDEPDSSDEEQEVTLSEEEQAEVNEKVMKFKTEGDDAFRAQNFEDARIAYTECITLLKKNKMKPNPTILANRAAVFLSLKRYVPAMHDATQSANADPTNWKAYWRQGIALMAMAQRKFRTKQAIEAFEACLKCESLPENKKSEVMQKYQSARNRLESQDAETPMPDMSNCAPS